MGSTLKREIGITIQEQIDGESINKKIINMRNHWKNKQIVNTVKNKQIEIIKNDEIESQKNDEDQEQEFFIGGFQNDEPILTSPINTKQNVKQQVRSSKSDPKELTKQSVKSDIEMMLMKNEIKEVSIRKEEDEPNHSFIINEIVNNNIQNISKDSLEQDQDSKNDEVFNIVPVEKRETTSNRNSVVKPRRVTTSRPKINKKANEEADNVIIRTLDENVYN